MRSLSRLLAESLPWGQRSFGDGRLRSDAFLKPLVVVVIVLLVGPDLVALVELTTLLDLLGATLFVIAFAVGFELLGVAALKWLRRLLLPPEYLMLIEMRDRPVVVAFGLLYVAGYVFILAAVCLSLCLLSYAGALALVQLVA